MDAGELCISAMPRFSISGMPCTPILWLYFIAAVMNLFWAMYYVAYLSFYSNRCVMIVKCIKWTCLNKSASKLQKEHVTY